MIEVNKQVLKRKYAPPKLMLQKDINALSFSYDMTLPSNNYNAYTLSRRSNGIFEDKVTDVVWQPDVYAYARSLADKNRITKIVDIGCGNAEKLIEAFDEARFSTIGIDYSGSLDIVRSLHPEKTWLEANLTDSESIEFTFQGFSDKTPRVYILSDVIEHIIDPRLLLRKLRALLKLNPDNILVISTPDSERGKSYNPKTKLPLNENHVREWSLNGLTQFLKASGFRIKKAGHTRSNQYDEQNNTCLVVVTANEQCHRSALKYYDFPKPSLSIIISTEHADQYVTGGIGSYIKEVETLMGERRPIIVYCGDLPFKESMSTKVQAENIVDIRSLVAEPNMQLSADWYSASTSVFEAMQNMLFLYDQIHTIEYQEYLGIGARLAEAKHARVLPFDINTVVRCHGSLVYTDRAAQIWSTVDRGDIFELERLSIRHADKVSFPTDYLKNLYLSTGYEFDNKTTTTQRLPYAYVYPDVPNPSYGKITNLAFLGKRWTMKGYEDFCYAVEDITDPKSKNYVSDIKEVTVIGKEIPGFEEFDNNLQTTLGNRGVKLTMEGLSHDKAINKMRKISDYTLFCLPYKGDNHPVSILEMIANRCLFIAYDQGGIPEMIPRTLHEEFLCFPDKTELVKKVLAVIAIPPGKNYSAVSTLHELAVKEQSTINKKVKEYYQTYEPAKPVQRQLEKLATVMVPIYDTDLRYVEDLLVSLSQQSLPPAEVIFVNDATPDENYKDKLKSLVGDKLKLPSKIINHEKNLGLAGARNTGLANCTTKYLINIDSDDIVSNDFIYDYVNFMESHPNYSAAICALESFFDDENYSVSTHDNRHRYLGLGDCYALGITKNIFGHSGSCLVAEKARKVGGWDASDKSKWEDWAFYMKLTTAGEKIFNFPKINYFYRDHPASMVKSYPKYQAQLRIIRNISGINIWESQRIYSYINSPRIIDKLVVVNNETADARALTFADTVVSHSRHYFHKHPSQRKAVKAMLMFAYKSLRYSKKSSKHPS